MPHVEKENTIYHVGISGGKDSVAALLYLLKIAKKNPAKINATFCDTQNEHEWTYAHVKFINDNVHPVQRLSSEGFNDLAKRKTRFPSTKARFCTQVLKIEPTQAHVSELQEKGFDVIVVSGTRADESDDRKNLPEWDFSGFSGAVLATHWRPLIHWNLQEVYGIHAAHGVPMNPLYEAGARRVGCLPCIMSRKAEIRMIALRFPKRIDEIRQIEKEVGSTFFPPNICPKRFRTTPYVTKKASS